MAKSRDIQRYVVHIVSQIIPFIKKPDQVRNPVVSTGLTSTSLDRAPAPSTNFVRGKSGFIPFWPGGLDEAAKDAVFTMDLEEESKCLKKIPPGFSRGLRLPGETDEPEEDLELSGINVAPRVHMEVYRVLLYLSHRVKQLV
jgi:antiviral helicase SKI2